MPMVNVGSINMSWVWIADDNLFGHLGLDFKTELQKEA
jgi:hypothetical protein